MPVGSIGGNGARDYRPGSAGRARLPIARSPGSRINPSLFMRVALWSVALFALCSGCDGRADSRLTKFGLVGGLIAFVLATSYTIWNWNKTEAELQNRPKGDH